jgi:membrane protein
MSIQAPEREEARQPEVVEEPATHPSPRWSQPKLGEKSFKGFVYFCARTVQEFLTNNSMQMAAAVAFYSFFSLFPLSLLIIVGYDIFRPDSPVRDEQLARVIGTFVPVSQGVIIQTVAGGARNLAVGPIAFIGLVWASTAVFATLRKGINVTWNIWVPRHFLKERIIDLSLTAGAGVLFMLLLYSTSVIRAFENPTGIFGGAAWESVLSLAITFGAFSFLFWFMPNCKVRFRDVLFGAFVAAWAFEIAKAIFFYYTLQRADLEQIYGSLSSVMLLLGWLYISAAIVLIGSLVGAVYTRLIELKIVSHLDVWSFGTLPAGRRLWRHYFPTLSKQHPQT